MTLKPLSLLFWCFRPRVFATHLLGISLACASSVPWAASVSNIPNLTAQIATTAAIAPDGGFVMAVLNPAVCASPAFTYGDSQSSSSCVTKFSASGQPVFSVQIGGALVRAVVLDSAGNIFLAGSNALDPSGFATTPGAYIGNPPGGTNPMVCKLSGADGQAIFCTFADVAGQLSVDAAGDVYLAGPLNNPSAFSGVEELNTTGTGVVYLHTVSAAIAAGLPDSNGNVYILGSDLDELNSSGAVVASVSLPNESPVTLLLDPAGNPEVLLNDLANPELSRVRKYAAGLSSLLFDTALLTSPSGFMVAEDSAGDTVLLGFTSQVNLAQVNATQSCAIPAVNALSALNAFLVRMDGNGNVVQSTYLDYLPSLVSGTMGVTSSGALALLYGPGSAVTALSLAPTAQTAGVGCVGNSASFMAMPIAPNEIVSVYGSGIGPSQPITAVPDENGFCPFQAGGTQVTFDGIAAPLLYVSSGQINLIAPGALAGKTSTQVCVLVNGISTNCITEPVSVSAVGVFGSGTYYSAEVPYAAALNQDGTVNSQENPAAVGSVVTLFVTGLGIVSPAVADGGVTPVPIPTQALQISAGYWLGELPPSFLYVPVLYGGPAPLEVEGLGQVNIPAPAGLGPAVVVYVSASTPDGSVGTNGSAAIWTTYPGQ